MTAHVAASASTNPGGARWPREGGHYESWFLRGNHPSRPLGFWIRYTIFAPADPSLPRQGELWAIWFDGEKGRITAAKSEHPLADCRFDRDRLDVAIPGATLDAARLVGTCGGADHRISWALDYDGAGPPLLLLAEPLYERKLPRAKALIGAPLARFRGTIDIDGESHAIDRWLGSGNHNWGSRHTDRYAWGQVAGFDGRDDVIFEAVTAKLKLGPIWTPWLTVAVMRVGDETLRFDSLARSPFASASIDGTAWSFAIGNGRERVHAQFSGPRDRFVGLRYRNPPGGVKICINSKIARCSLRLERPGVAPLELATEHRAAFELLRDDAMEIPVVA